LETDSTLEVKAISDSSQIAWSLRSRWANLKILISHMNYVVTHIFREGNQVADTLTNVGLGLDSFMFWNEIPLFIRENLVKNKIGWPSCRFF